MNGVNKLKEEVLSYDYDPQNRLDIVKDEHKKLIGVFIGYLEEICQQFSSFEINIKGWWIYLQDIYLQDISLTFTRKDTNTTHTGVYVFTNQADLYDILLIILAQTTAYLFLRPDGFKLNIENVLSFYEQGYEFMEELFKRKETYYV